MQDQAPGNIAQRDRYDPWLLGGWSLSYRSIAPRCRWRASFAAAVMGAGLLACGTESSIATRGDAAADRPRPRGDVGASLGTLDGLEEVFDAGQTHLDQRADRGRAADGPSSVTDTRAPKTDVGSDVSADVGPTPSRPNFVVILVDDMDVRSMVHFPRLRRLLYDEGTSFEQYITPHALCCPSRVSFLRGQYAHNHGIWKIIGTLDPADGKYKDGGWPAFRDAGLEGSTIATWLSDAGYTTLYAGKYMNQYAAMLAEFPPLVGYRVPGWTYWYGSLTNRYLGYGFEVNENGTVIAYPHSRDNPGVYHTDLIADKAVEFIRAANGPFLLYLATTTPHVPAVPANRHKGRFSGARLPQPPSFDEADVSDKPSWVARYWPRISAERKAALQSEYQRRLESMLSVEDLVERVVQALGQGGLLDNTYIFFTSDHGYHLGEHRSWSKHTFYEEDIRVPFVVRGPNIARGRRLSHLLLNNDLAPTLADLAGVATPSFIDGRSFRSLLHPTPPRSSRWRTMVLLERHPIDARYGGRAFGVRSDRWKYVEWDNGERELYDLLRDPHELQSQHKNRAHAELMRHLSERLRELRTCAGAHCTRGESASPLP